MAIHVIPKSTVHASMSFQAAREIQGAHTRSCDCFLNVLILLLGCPFMRQEVVVLRLDCPFRCQEDVACMKQFVSHTRTQLTRI